MTEIHDPFGARHTIDTPLGERVIYRLDSLAGLGDIENLPYSIKVLLESALRNHDGRVVRDTDVESVAQFNATNVGETEGSYEAVLKIDGAKVDTKKVTLGAEKSIKIEKRV